MRKYLAALATTGVLFLGSAAHGQKATEIYIPIGKSPGLSGRQTVIGTIDTIDRREQVMTVAGSRRSWTAHVSDDTVIWLDRTKLRLTNKVGTPADCKEGLLVEVKFVGNDRKKGVCEWVKVRVSARGRPRGQPRRRGAREDDTLKLSRRYAAADATRFMPVIAGCWFPHL